MARGVFVSDDAKCVCVRWAHPECMNEQVLAG